MRREAPSQGERRTVTVLFVDVVGSTPLAEKLGEEEMYSFMRECLARMSESVHAYEGHVAAFTGDGLMALFGAPIAHEDSARRAVAAALRMQRSLTDYATEVADRHGELAASRKPPSPVATGGREACHRELTLRPVNLSLPAASVVPWRFHM
jgi:class 3 adenylate cyclase